MGKISDSFVDFMKLLFAEDSHSFSLLVFGNDRHTLVIMLTEMLV